MRRMWQFAEIGCVLEQYAENGPAALAEQLGRSIHSVSSKARQYRIQSRTQHRRATDRRAANSPMVNATFFDTPTQSACYVAGYIWARASVKLKHRQVLRLTGDLDSPTKFNHVRQLLGSQHQVQVIGRRLIAEICNSHLVSMLVENFGSPNKSQGEQAFPNLPYDGLLYFAYGNLIGMGLLTESTVRWTGTPRFTTQLATQIQKGCEVGPPETHRYGGRVHAAWTQLEDVERIISWLPTPPATDPGLAPPSSTMS